MRNILYVYPQWHTVSFSLVAKHHIKHLKKWVRVQEWDELSFPEFYPVARWALIIHPYFYVVHRWINQFMSLMPNTSAEQVRNEIRERWRKFDKVIAVEVADSDRISDLAVWLLEPCSDVVVPSTFSQRAFIESGCRKPVHVVPHGVDLEWYDTEYTAALPAPNPTLEVVRHLKEVHKVKLLLFWLWHCYDEQTRILTKEGFKYWWELKPNDEVATVNMETGELVYQKPEKIIISDYDGVMVHFEGQHYDLMVTPNHRMIVRISRKQLLKAGRKDFKNDVVDPVRSWRAIYAEDLYKEWRWAKWELLRAVKWRGRRIEYVEFPDVKLEKGYPKWALNNVKNKPRIVKKVPIKPLLRFLGWFIAEGHARYNEHNQEYLIFITNKKKENIDEIVRIVKELGFHPIVTLKKDTGVYQIIIASKQLYIYIKSLGLPTHPDIRGDKSIYKFVPKFIKELDVDLIREFVDALWKGDGTYYITKNGEKKYLKYITKSKRLAEDVAELLLKLGYAVTIHRDKANDTYQVIPSERYRFPMMCKEPKLVHYRGKIWCVTVPNGTVIVERNGKVVVSGNSPERKGWPEVQEFMVRLSRERKDVTLVLVTTTPASADQLSYSTFRCVNVWGFLNDNEKMYLYDLADLTLLFSRGGAFELCGLESIARGTPAIGHDKGAWVDYMPDFLRVKADKRVKVFEGNSIHVGYGYTVDVENALDLAHNILDNLNEYRARTKEYAVNVLRDVFNWRSVSRKLLEVVKE